MARCIQELERIYGIRNGGDRKSDSNYLSLKTQTDIDILVHQKPLLHLN